MAHFASYNTSDSTTGNTPLTAGGTITLGPLQTAQEGQICGTVFADQPGTLYIEQSFDGGKNFDLSASYSVTSSHGAGFTEAIIAPVSQVRFTNGNADQAVMRLFVRCFGIKASGA